MTVEVIKNFIPNDLCKNLNINSKSQIDQNFGVSKGFRESFANLPPEKEIDSNQIVWHLQEQLVEINDQNLFVAKNISKILFEIKEEIEKFYQVKVNEVQSSLIKMLEGAKNTLHSDMYLLDGGEWHGGYGERSSFKYSALLYLSTFNQDFGGGEIIFPDYDIKIQPEAGQLVFFTGDLKHKHYVPKVTYGERLCLVAFFRP